MGKKDIYKLYKYKGLTFKLTYLDELTTGLTCCKKSDFLIFFFIKIDAREEQFDFFDALGLFLDICGLYTLF